jgi:hypothetical protein
LSAIAAIHTNQNLSREFYIRQRINITAMKIFTLLFMLAFSQLSIAQLNDSTTYQKQDAEKGLRTHLGRSLIVPGILIGYGLTTIKDNGLYSSYQARTDLRNLTKGRGGPVDDYLIASPYLLFAGLVIARYNCKNDAWNTGLLILKSQVIMSAITFPAKRIAGLERPYSYQRGLDGVPLEERKKNSNNFQSIPSGHTAQAFVAATIVYREYRHKSPWPGIAAYALAGTVGVYRMINDQHWQSDVLVGAGVGILSANLAYATHTHRWGRKEVCFYPTIGPAGTKGLGLSLTF